jgi:hypothetical protein
MTRSGWSADQARPCSYLEVCFLNLSVQNITGAWLSLIGQIWYKEGVAICIDHWSFQKALVISKRILVYITLRLWTWTEKKNTSDFYIFLSCKPPGPIPSWHQNACRCKTRQYVDAPTEENSADCSRHRLLIRLGLGMPVLEFQPECQGLKPSAKLGIRMGGFVLIICPKWIVTYGTYAQLRRSQPVFIFVMVMKLVNG